MDTNFIMLKYFPYVPLMNGGSNFFLSIYPFRFARDIINRLRQLAAPSVRLPITGQLHSSANERPLLTL